MQSTRWELAIIYPMGAGYATRYAGELLIDSYDALVTFWADGESNYDALCAGGF